MKTASRKSKGRALQKHVAKVIQEIFSLPEEDVVSRPMGSAGSDIMMSKRARKLVPIELECKNHKKFPSIAALQQSRDIIGGKNLLPGVVWKPNQKSYDECIIYFNFREFLEFFKKINEK